ncbi:MAG: hypothetical protein JO036_11085 [Candidatus Eremiobacteraeota bacterium]|nr:hypothetical protein [Candidatus Eremiobacteraeota bacterium]
MTACARTGSSGPTGARSPSSTARLRPSSAPVAARPAARPIRAAVRPLRAGPEHPVADRPATSAPDPRPYILGASVSPSVVGSGTTVHAVVRTTPGVVTVVAFAGGSSMAVPRVGPGLFEGSTTLPPLPPFARGSYAVTFVARDARGRSTQSAVGVSVR